MTMKNKKRNAINKHTGSYNYSTEHALRAIYEECDIHYQGQVYSYDKQHNELSIKDFYGSSIYIPFFNAGLCNPFKELKRQEVNTYE